MKVLEKEQLCGSFVCNFATGKIPARLELVAKCRWLVQPLNLPCINKTVQAH